MLRRVIIRCLLLLLFVEKGMPMAGVAKAKPSSIMFNVEGLPNAGPRETIKVRNPLTGEHDYEIAPTRPCEVASAVAGARAAQSEWQLRGVAARCAALRLFADALDAEQGDVVAALSIDTGRQGIAALEVASVVGSLQKWASEAPRLMPTFAGDAGEGGWHVGRGSGLVKHRNEYLPYAVVGVISPWNFPMLLSFIDAIPALLAGSAVVIKPSEVTPRFADRLIPVIAKAGLADVIKLVHGGAETGEALVDCVDYICFTGSVPTGKKVAVRAAGRLIPANLELGGKDALIVTEGADLEAATTIALRASVLATGQACQSIERIYVPRSTHDDFVRLLAEKAKAVELGFPGSERGGLGPFIWASQAEMVQRHIDDAVARGARLLTGGKILNHGGGLWLEPTVLADVTHEMAVMRDETFGPVLPVMAFDTIDEAVSLANDSAYGLSGAVYSTDAPAALAVARGVDAGAISLMDASLTDQYFEADKQSTKDSGLGPSRMGAAGFLRFFRSKAYITNTGPAVGIEAFLK